MRQVLYELAEVLKRGDLCAFGEVIDTSGSTPQKPGAKAIFWADGRSSGTLGGGCLEAEARRVALNCLRERTRTLLTLHLDSDFGFDDGLICGGTARIFIDGKPDEQKEFWLTVTDFLRSRQKGAIVTIVKSNDPSLLGLRWLLKASGKTFQPDEHGFELEVIAKAPQEAMELPETAFELARQAIEQRDELTANITLASVDAELFIEPVIPKPHLIIAGAGHIGAALAHLCSLLEFEVTVVDDRPSFANRERIPEADNVLVGDIAETVSSQSLDKDTYIVIVTRGHRHDADVLRSVIRRIDEVAYIGMIGSRRKIKLIYDELIAQGITTPEQLAKVHSPIGIDIGGESVWEIAVSIAAELVWVRNGCSGSLRPLQEKMLPLVLKEATVTKD